MDGLPMIILIVIVISVRDGLGARREVFRHPTLDTNPWMPVETGQTYPGRLSSEEKLGKKSLGSAVSQWNSGKVEIEIKKKQNPKQDINESKMSEANKHNSIKDEKPEASELRETIVKWSKKLESKDLLADNIFEPSDDSEKRVYRSAFLDPDEVGINNNHGQMHHSDHMTGSNNKNNTNVQNENPHDKNKQFCVDISEYLDLKWVIKESEECHVNFNRETSFNNFWKNINHFSKYIHLNTFFPFLVKIIICDPNIRMNVFPVNAKLKLRMSVLMLLRQSAR